METKEIIDALQMKRSLIRISHEIIEHNRGVEDIVLIGIKTRGEILARRLADIICNVEDISVPCFALDRIGEMIGKSPIPCRWNPCR